MSWLIRVVEVVALMFGTDVLWLTWGWWQRAKFKELQKSARLTAGRAKKKGPIRMRQAVIPKAKQ